MTLLERRAKRFFVGICPYCDETVDEPRQGHDHEVPRSSGLEPDGERAKVRVVADSAEMVKFADLNEFDAWLSSRSEYAEVLEAFRSFFGTDTSAAAMESDEAKGGGGRG